MSLLKGVLGNVTGATLWAGSWLQGIILAYCLCKFWKLRRETVYIKRRGDIATAYTICIIIVFIFGYPLRLLLHWQWKAPLIPYMSIPYIILTILNDLMFAPFYYSTTFLTILRYWLIYYDIKFSTSCLNLEWKQCIKSDIDSTDAKETKMEKWYIEHRKNYGNQSFLMNRIIILTSIISILSMGSVWIYEFGITTLELWLLLNIPMYLFCGGLIVYISKKMPEFKDKIYLHQEGKLLSLMWIIATSFYGLVSITEMCIGRTIITFFVSELASMIGSFSMSFISTYWVIKQVEVDMLNNLEMVVVGEGSRVSRPSQSEVASTTSTNYKSDDYVTLQMLLSDKDLFGLYMQHLLKEFSMECLLAVIEFTQFKQHAMNTFNTANIDINDTQFGKSGKYKPRNKLLIFPKSVPLSDIVYGYGTDDLSINIDLNSPTNSETDKTLLLLFKDKAHRLYHKYIATGSPFEINISYKMRGELNRLLHEYHQCINNTKLTEKELINIFDQCIDEMIQLLKASKSRFLAQNKINMRKHSKSCIHQTEEQDSF